MKVNLTIPGKPPTKLRARKGRGGFYTPKETKQAMNKIALYGIAKGKKLEGNLKLTLRAYYRTKKHGDLDNIIKVIMDSCQGIIFENDLQIKEIYAILKTEQDNERTEIEIEEI